jgi:hypothetical protein
VTLSEARRLGYRHVRRPCWPVGTFLEFIHFDEVPIRAWFMGCTATAIAVAFFSGWSLRDRLFWALPWDDYEGLALHGED